METTITTITIVFIVLAMIAAWMAYEMTHAYELPEDEGEDEDDDEDEETKPRQSAPKRKATRRAKNEPVLYRD